MLQWLQKLTNLSSNLKWELIIFYSLFTINSVHIVVNSYLWNWWVFMKKYESNQDEIIHEDTDTIIENITQM